MQNDTKFFVGLYREMQRIRMCEESLVDPIMSGDIKCPVHLCSGQEAVSVGICSALEIEDYIFGNHRSHGHFIAKGGRIDQMIAEIFGKKTGCSKGRGGSMHLMDTGCGMMGSAPIVAGTISLAVGAALASSIRKDGRVAVTFFGDGATNEGVLYESLNLAALKKLPVIFVCENNLYATHMPINECRPCKDIVEIATPFDIKSEQIDGNDVIQVLETAKQAVSACRNGNGPYFIEALTYRLRGHVGPDDNIQGSHTDIRPESEIVEWRTKDPILLLKRKLENLGVSQDEIRKIDNSIEDEINQAHQYTHTSAYPGESELGKYVFKE